MLQVCWEGMGGAKAAEEGAGDEEEPFISVDQCKVVMCKMAGDDEVEEVLEEEGVGHDEMITFSILVKLAVKAKHR